jgi:DNA-binding NarL/FixJ family response regulator
MPEMRDRLTKILTADDHPDIARRIGRAVAEMPGVDLIGPGRDGDEALKLYQAHRPHGMILDFQMPLLTGLEVLIEVRKTDRDCLIIILTSAEEESLRKQCLAAGANFFLIKGSETEIALNIVRRYAAFRNETNT